MSKHSSIFSVSVPTREQRTGTDKMAFSIAAGGGGSGGEGAMEGKEAAGRSVV